MTPADGFRARIRHALAHGRTVLEARGDIVVATPGGPAAWFERAPAPPTRPVPITPVPMSPPQGPLRLTDALELVRLHEEELVDTWTRDLVARCALVFADEAIRTSILSRSWVVAAWPAPAELVPPEDGVPPSLPWAALLALAPRLLLECWLPLLPGLIDEDLMVPFESPFGDAATRVTPPRPELVPTLAEASAWVSERVPGVVRRAGGAQWGSHAGLQVDLQALGGLRCVGLLCAAERDVEEGRRRLLPVISTNGATSTLMTAWSGATRGARRLDQAEPELRRELEAEARRYEWAVQLLDRSDPTRDRNGRAPVLHAQIGLPYKEAITDAVIGAVSRAVSPSGLRDFLGLWFAATEAGRTPSFKFRLSDHLARLGLPDRPDRRAEVGDRLATLRRLEIRVVQMIDGNPRIRATGPLFTVQSVIDEFDEDLDQWLTVGATMSLNPHLYDGVRAGDGVLGRSFVTFSPELLRLHGSNEAPAIMLGARLPFGWRRDFERQGQPFSDYTAQTLLYLADIGGVPAAKKRRGAGPLARRGDNPGRALEHLAEALETLDRIGAVGRWEQIDKSGPLMSRKVRLWAPDWTLDRLRGVRPIEAPSPLVALPSPHAPLAPASATPTGADLTRWREQVGLTKIQAAAALGVTRHQVQRAEAAPSEALGWKVRRALEAALVAAASKGSEP